MGNIDKEERLKYLKDSYTNCTDCNLHKLRTKVVHGYGNPDARLFLLAEAPGITEDNQGIPLCGPSGNLLFYILANLGVDREQTWSSNCVLCIPRVGAVPSRSVQPPTKPQLAACASRLENEVYTVDPIALLVMGSTAVSRLRGAANLKMGTAAGRTFRFEMPGRRLKTISYPAVATWHPAYILRQHLIRIENGIPVPAHKDGESWLNHIRLAVDMANLPRSY